MADKDRILCSKMHTWVEETDENIVVGLTDILALNLGEIIYVELPEVGDEVLKDEVFATVKSVKSVNELYMPVSGKIVEVNESLINSPEMLNEDSFNAWLVKVKADDFLKDSEDLLEYDDYLDENY